MPLIAICFDITNRNEQQWTAQQNVLNWRNCCVTGSEYVHNVQQFCFKYCLAHVNWKNKRLCHTQTRDEPVPISAAGYLSLGLRDVRAGPRGRWLGLRWRGDSHRTWRIQVCRMPKSMDLSFVPKSSPGTHQEQRHSLRRRRQLQGTQKCLPHQSGNRRCSGSVDFFAR